jgi:hypothetical protein
MLYYKVNSLDALNKLEDANYYASKKEANKKAPKTIISNPYDFL